MTNTSKTVLVMIAVLTLASTAEAAHCTNKFDLRRSIERKYNNVGWAVINSKDYAEFAAAVATTAATAGATSPAVGVVLQRKLGNLLIRLANTLGKETARKVLVGLVKGTTTFTDLQHIVVGRQVWSRKECVPSCGSRFKHCVPLPADNAFYVAVGRTPPRGACIMYQHAGFRGRKQSLGRNRQISRFPRGSLNDQVSSVRVPSGCTLLLYKHWDFRGYEHIYQPGNYGRVRANDQYSSAKCRC